MGGLGNKKSNNSQLYLIHPALSWMAVLSDVGHISAIPTT